MVSIGEAALPRISEFYGVVVTMYFHDHPPPHFHVRYAEHEAAVAIDSLETLGGFLPQRARALVLEWSVLHRAELRQNFKRAQAGRPLVPIKPLP